MYKLWSETSELFWTSKEWWSCIELTPRTRVFEVERTTKALCAKNKYPSKTSAKKRFADFHKHKEYPGFYQI